MLLVLTLKVPQLSMHNVLAETRFPCVFTIVCGTVLHNELQVLPELLPGWVLPLTDIFTQGL